MFKNVQNPKTSCLFKFEFEAEFDFRSLDLAVFPSLYEYQCVSLIVGVSLIVCVHEYVCVVPPGAGSQCCYTPLSGSPPHSLSVFESSGPAHSQGQGRVVVQRPPPYPGTDTPSLRPSQPEDHSYYTLHTNSGWSQASASPKNQHTQRRF